MFEKPSLADLRRAAQQLGMNPSDDYLRAVEEIVTPLAAAYAALDAMPDELPAVKYPRGPVTWPQADENRYGAWYVKTSIKGQPNGPLAGRRVALKDNICLAGVPMTLGADVFEGYVPEVDATIVERILDAGGEIAGKAVCEYYCVSGGSHTSSSGPVHNPRKAGYTTGGSSSGSAALVAAGEVDMSIGGDQGGSIRIPASYCGIYGMKATHGLVPYTGVMPIESTIDHTGPITANVADNALLLEVLAGPDGLDPRQYGAAAQSYGAGLNKGVSGLRIAMVEESFGWEQSMPQVDSVVKQAAAKLRDMGAIVDVVSIPMHRIGAAIWLPVAAEGATMQMMLGNGFGFNWQGLYVTSMLDFHSAWRTRADELSDTLKNTMLLGHYMVTRYRGHYYAKAQNLVRRLRRAYDEVLSRYDLLLMPTVPIVATPLPEANAPVAEILQYGFGMLANTPQFDCTHHPAMSLPCGMVDGLPVGMMLVAKAFEEEMIYRAAASFENGVDWKGLRAG